MHRKCAMKALDDVINYLNEEEGQVAVSICCSNTALSSQ